MTFISSSVTADDLRHELIAYAQDRADREFMISENAKLKKDRDRAGARYFVWRNFIDFLRELHITSAEDQG